MPDLIINPANVRPLDTQPEYVGLAGETVLAGEFGRLDDTVRKWFRVVTNFQEELAQGQGLFIVSAELDQEVVLRISGRIFCGSGSGISPGVWYAGSDTPGKIRPADEAPNGQWVPLVGIGDTGDVLELYPIAPSIQRAP